MIASLRVLLAVAATLLALLAVPAMLVAQPEDPAGPRFSQQTLATAQERWLPTLTAPASPELLTTLAEMRARPDLARAMLWHTVDPPEEAPPPIPPVTDGRWRLFHHLAEFGRTADIPRLLADLEEVTDSRERRMREGTARGLYPAWPEPVSLELAVADFVFIQTGRAEPHDSERDGLYPLDTAVFEAWHRAEVPIEAIARLDRLRGRDFRSVRQAAEAMQTRLGERLWERWRDDLLAPFTPLPPRLRVEGLLRLQLINPAERPLLTRVSYGVWFGDFVDPPRPGYAYAPAQGRAVHDQPVTLIVPVRERSPDDEAQATSPDEPRPAARQEARVRLDLRLQEVHQAPQPVYRKLALALEP